MAKNAGMFMMALLGVLAMGAKKQTQPGLPGTTTTGTTTKGTTTTGTTTPPATNNIPGWGGKPGPLDFGPARTGYGDDIAKARAQLEAQAALTHDGWLALGATEDQIAALCASAALELSRFNALHNQEAKVAAQYKVDITQVANLPPAQYDALVRLPLGIVVPDPDNPGGYMPVPGSELYNLAMQAKYGSSWQP